MSHAHASPTTEAPIWKVIVGLLLDAPSDVTTYILIRLKRYLHSR